MARKDNNDVIVAGIDEINNDDPQITEVKDAETKVETQTSPPKNVTQQMVTVRVNTDHSCRIGGVYYVFKRMGVYQVPTDVKRILVQSGLLAAL